MRPFLSFAALFLLLTPALAQQTDQPPAAPDQQEVAAQPDAEQPATSQAGRSQADALAAAQDADDQAAQSQGEQTGAQYGEPSGEQSNAERYPEAQQQPIPPPPSAEPAPPQPYDPEQGGDEDRVRVGTGVSDGVGDGAGNNDQRVEQNAAPWPQADQPYDRPGADQANAQPRRPERRTLQVSPAVRPRAEAAAYPVYRQQAQLSVGAKLLSAREVEQKFSTPLGKHYVVVEVGIFPAAAAELREQDFTLRADRDDQAFFPSTPEDIASALANSGRPHRVGFYPSVGIGFENGPWGRGVSSGIGVGVGGGPRAYPRGPMGANRRVMENELRDKSLPEGSLTQPVAGYLYFPVKQQRNTHYNLEFTRNGEIVSLPLPTPQD